MEKNNEKTNASTQASKEKSLLKKFEHKRNNTSFVEKKEMYLKQTDRNYKDGDRN